MIVGIDPGASGALAFFDMEQGALEIIDMPVMEIERSGKLKREISPTFLAKALDDFSPAVAYVEKVGAMPGQGVSSMFQFGRGVGMVEGVLAALAIPVYYVTPQQWQKSTGTRGGKDGSRLRAVELFPKYAPLFARKKDDGRADAALIAWHGATL
jgi:crossover junction endodeoxyribonuclease RuvC